MSWILPVFAGMVRAVVPALRINTDSPRIRGDGPDQRIAKLKETGILPVFAGMVPPAGTVQVFGLDSPRIRGDGPCNAVAGRSPVLFSPYSRGWSFP